MRHPEFHIPVSVRKPAQIGLWVSVGVLIVLLLWAFVAQLNSGAVAIGEVIPAGNVKTVQHLDGGMIKEIFVKDGDVVTKGQELLRLDETEADASLAINVGELAALDAWMARLRAERDVRALPPSKARLPSSSIDTQLRLFHIRREALHKDISILQQRAHQAQEEVEALRSEEKALSVMGRNAEDAKRMTESLYERNFISKPKLLEGQSNVAQIQGAAGRNAAEIARARQKVIETELQIAKLKNEWMNSVLEDLRKVEDERAKSAERVRVAQDRRVRTSLVAPQEGIVKGLRYSTVGGVIPPGGVVMDIIPTADRLLIEARISPDDVDVVYPGLVSHVRLTAFKSRTHRALKGRVAQVSADTFRDERTGASYYKARIEIDDAELESIDKLTLSPGMLAQVEIVVGERSVMRYLFDPVIDSFNRAFKEQ